ncbi:MAG: hypothetical protein Fur0043_21280 [Anaerolineales bacterium]
MRNLIAFPLLILVAILQSAVISRITLLAGYADLMLVVLAAWSLQADVASSWQWALLGGLLVSFISRMPWFVVFAGYLGVVALAHALRGRVWQAPLLAMLTVIFLGTILMNFVAYVTLQLFSSPLPLGDTFGLIVLPSLLLNLLFALPIYAIMRDLAHWVYPVQEAE